MGGPAIQLGPARCLQLAPCHPVLETTPGRVQPIHTHAPAVCARLAANSSTPEKTGHKSAETHPTSWPLVSGRLLEYWLTQNTAHNAPQAGVVPVLQWEHRYTASVQSLPPKQQPQAASRELNNLVAAHLEPLQELEVLAAPQKQPLSTGSPKAKTAKAATSSTAFTRLTSRTPDPCGGSGSHCTEYRPHNTTMLPWNQVPFRRRLGGLVNRYATEAILADARLLHKKSRKRESSMARRTRTHIDIQQASHQNSQSQP